MIAIGLTACSALPQPPLRADVYDFGPGPMLSVPADRRAPLAPVILGDVVSGGVPEGSTALRYRLAYANAQQLRAYSRARWSQPPAQLLAQALRERLGERRTVLASGGVARDAGGGAPPDTLRVELEEFSQVFSTPQDSVGLVRVRASLLRSVDAGEQVQAQRLFIVQRPATTQDAAGGARALADAAMQVADELQEWLVQVQR